MIKILTEKCVGCGLCVQDCPMKNLSMADGKASVRNGCMECGHCYAICPSRAIELTDYPAEGIMELSGTEPVVDGNSLLVLIKSRRSIRNFQPKAVSRETWCSLLEAGRFTATAANRQDVKYTVIQDNLLEVKQEAWAGVQKLLTAFRSVHEEQNPLIRQLKIMCETHEQHPENDPLFFNAPALLVITSASPLTGGLACSNIELMAHTQGLGVLISGFIQTIFSQNDTLCHTLNIDAKRICACLLVGYPNVKYQRTVPRKEANIQWF